MISKSTGKPLLEAHNFNRWAAKNPDQLLFFLVAAQLCKLVRVSVCLCTKMWIKIWTKKNTVSVRSQQDINQEDTKKDQKMLTPKGKKTLKKKTTPKMKTFLKRT